MKINLELIFLCLFGLSIVRGVWGISAALRAIAIVALAYFGIIFLEKAPGWVILLFILACGKTWLECMGVNLSSGADAPVSSGNTTNTGAAPFSTSASVPSAGDLDGGKDGSGGSGSSGSSGSGSSGSGDAGG